MEPVDQLAKSCLTAQVLTHLASLLAAGITALLQQLFL